MPWRRIEIDGRTWEARALADEAGEILEFRCLDAPLPPRRIAVSGTAARAMDEATLRDAHRRALPIGADHYGRPGKRMDDAGG